MAHEWTPNTPTYGGQMYFSVTDGVTSLAFDVQDEGEVPHSETQQAALLGVIKDALEAANLTVGPIVLLGGASKTLTEV